MQIYQDSWSFRGLDVSLGLGTQTHPLAAPYMLEELYLLCFQLSGINDGRPPRLYLEQNRSHETPARACHENPRRELKSRRNEE